MENIQLNIKLSAYTKGILPKKVSDLENDLYYISDAPNDDIIYARKNNDWIDINEVKNKLSILVGPGIQKEDISLNEILLSLKQWVGNIEDLPTLQDDFIYYVIENKPDLFIVGGSAFSDGENDFVDSSEFNKIYVGGNANTSIFDIITLPIDSKGVSN